jgi:MFS family permease
VRKLLLKLDEIRILGLGLAASCAGLLLIGFAPAPWMLYAGLAALALGSGFVNPASTGLISLYTPDAEQGRVLGIFRSLGSHSRARSHRCSPARCSGSGARPRVFIAAILAAIAGWLSLRLPKPAK